MTDDTTSSAATCPVCGGPTDEPFVRVPSQPIHCNVLWERSDAARSAPVGDIELVFCPTCGHIHNSAFDDALTTYGGTYENSLHHSGVFQAYAAAIVTDLVERYDLHDADIVEIGAGQGDFLAELCRAGSSRGTGFDPSHVGSDEKTDGVRMVTAFYGPEFADHPADLITCRHVLEHIGASGEFVSMLRRVVGDRPTPVFFEVPDALWTIRGGGIWDLIYEHCGYFTPISLAEVFRRSGFGVDRVRSVFGDQFLTIDAHPVDSIPEPDGLEASVADVASAVADFARRYEAEVASWRARLRGFATDGRRVAIWGAGSKGVTFLNTVDTDGAVDVAIDINPRKHGMFIAGSGQRIVSPDELPDLHPDVVIVMNPNYLDEVRTALVEIGSSADVLAV